MNVTWTHVQLLWLREWYRIRHYFWGGIINTSIFWPITFAFGYGYIAPMCYFGRIDGKMATMLYVGMLLLQLFVMAHTVGMVIMQERTTQKIIQYQASCTSLSLVYAVRSLFYSLWVAVRMLPFFPVSKLVLGEGLYTEHLSWMGLSGLIILCSFLSVSYASFLSSMVKSITESGSLWERYIEPLLLLGGVWVPLVAMVKTSKILGLICLLNPFLYITEAIRGLFFTDQVFISLPLCVSIIVVSSGFLFFFSYHLMRRRLDAV